MYAFNDQKIYQALPVVQENKLIGIISIGDVVKYIIEEQKFIIENLEHYITGTWWIRCSKKWDEVLA